MSYCLSRKCSAKHSAGTKTIHMDNLVASNIRQRPIRTLVSVAGVALGVCLIMLFTGLARGMSNDLQRRASNVRAEIIFTRPGSMQLTASTANLSTKYVDSLTQIAGAKPWLMGGQATVPNAAPPKPAAPDPNEIAAAAHAFAERARSRVKGLAA